jgi:hypothetical protein
VNSIFSGLDYDFMNLLVLGMCVVFRGNLMMCVLMGPHLCKC